METAINVRHLHVSYYGNEVIRNINFTIERGKLIGIIGPNGAGKSTLMKALLGLIPNDKGEVEIYGKNIKEMRTKIAYVPQRNDIDWDFPITVLDTVLLGTYPNLGLFKKPKRKEKEWAFQCLQRVGMEDYAQRQIGELSGGQQQRVFLARALAQKSEIFFLDEPFVGIDLTSEKMIVNILKELRDEGNTILVVHHDLSKVTEYFDQLVVLNKHLIGYGDVDEVIHSDVLSKAYKGQLPFLEGLGVGV